MRSPLATTGRVLALLLLALLSPLTTTLHTPVPLPSPNDDAPMRPLIPARLAGPPPLLPPVPPPTPIPIPLPSSLPPTAHRLSGPLVGLSIEQDRFPLWSGPLGAPNPYTRQVLQNVADRAGGVPPPVRVGGNTEDRTRYDPAGVADAVGQWPPPTARTPWPEATGVTVGRDFWRLAANFPNGTQFVFGVNLKGRNASEAAAQARGIVDAFAGMEGVSLARLELGNEPDNYGWSISEYASQWNSLATSILRTLPSPSPPFQILAFSNPSSWSNFTLSSALTHNLTSSPSFPLLRERVTTVSEHHYQASYCAGTGGKLADLMRKGDVRANLGVFRGEIRRAQEEGWEFELGETNSVSCHGAPGVSNTGGAAIWAVDYALQACTLGIARLYLHHGIGYTYNTFSPTSLFHNITDGAPLPSSPHVLPLYYALLVLAEATGAGGVWVGELEVGSADVAAYGVWEGTGAQGGSRLRRVVIVNSAAFLSAPPSARGTYTYTVSLPSSPSPSPTSFLLLRLAVPFADATHGLKWAGQAFESVDGRGEGERTEEEVLVGAGGKAVFGGEASEVLVLEFGEG